MLNRVATLLFTVPICAISTQAQIELDGPWAYFTFPARLVLQSATKGEPQITFESASWAYGPHPHFKGMFILSFKGTLARDDNIDWVFPSFELVLEMRSGPPIRLKASPRSIQSTHEIVGTQDCKSGIDLGEIRAYSITAIATTYWTKQVVPSYAGIIAKDKACYRDLLHDLSLGGVAERKGLLEFVQVGCGVLVDKPRAVSDATTVGYAPGSEYAYFPVNRDDNDDNAEGVYGIIPKALVEKRTMWVLRSLSAVAAFRHDVQPNREP